MKNRISRILSVGAAAAAGLLLLAGVASAHVTVSPGVSSPGAWETYSIKIPTEKDIPTVKVSLKVPEELEFKQYRPIPDWKVELTKDDAGKVTVVTWSSEGEGIGPGEFQQFEFVGKNPADEADLAWDAFQYYSDGSIVEWSGEEGSDKPHSITKVTADPAVAESGHADQGHDHGTGEGTSGNTAGTETGTSNTGNATASNGGTAGSDTGGNTGADNTGSDSADANRAPGNNGENGSSTMEITTMIVSIAALIVSLIAFGFAVRSRKK